MKPIYDPGAGAAFWAAIEKLPGYPSGEHMPIPIMLFESNAVYKLPDVMTRANAQRDKPLLVVMDKTPMIRQGKYLKQLVMEILSKASWLVQSVFLEPDGTGQVHTDMPHIEVVKKMIQPGASLLAVGSGTVCDITKHAAYLYEKETGSAPSFVAFQTANSVSAFTSNMAPTFVDGVKRTLPSRYPNALVCDLETLADAPYDMTVAGVGDLLAAFVSFPDWYLAHELGMDPAYSEFAQLLMGPLDEVFLASAKKIHDRSPEGMAILAKLIALGGLAMSLSHATTPMSGYEHVISHVLDMLAETEARPLAQHGTQVALATLLAADAYQHFLNEFDPLEVNLDSCYPKPASMEKLILNTFGTIDPSGGAGRECWADYRLKLDLWNENRPRFESLRQDWPSVQAHLSQLTRTPEQLLEILRAIDAPLNFDQIVPPVSEVQIRFAFMNAPLMRRRLTVGDLLLFSNWDRDRLWQQIWARSQTLAKA